ncbi:MAG: hypothetical protein JWO71_4445 [Candidatus Acidoferrum typicum]|nr:hypothetical protein [Candidatus Acidoferrum typicum]
MALPLRSLRSVLCLRLVLVLELCLVATFISSVAWSKEGPQTQVAATVRNLPISFEPNKGQGASPVRFITNTGNLKMYLRPKGIDLVLAGPKNTASLALNFGGSDPNANFVASDEQEGYSNYILGVDPSRWLTHVPHFGRVTYQAIYPGVDAAFYGNGLRLEHDFIVGPGADYRLIRIHVDGPTNIHLQHDGSLRLLFPDGELTFETPQVYQISMNSKIMRKGHFALLGKKEFGFVVEDYDKSRPLIIDPVLSYSTYLADVSVVMAGVATDATGDTFSTGLVFSPNFPVTPGAYQTTCKSCTASIQQPDVFISKINASGTALVYSTFLGGSDYDQPYGIAVDATGNAVVVGRTQSTDFPTQNPIAVGTSGNGTSYGFISSLSFDGSALNYSSVLGGGAQPFQSSFTTVGGVALDSNGNAYIAGTTDSPVFPTTPGALNMTTPAYPKNVVFVSKFLTTGNLGYSALLGDASPQNGGGGPVGVFGIGVDATGSAYITGSSGTLWPTTSGSFQTSIPGSTPYAAPFVTKLSQTGSSLAYSTFLGDGGYSTAITMKPATGEAFVTGVYAGNSSGNHFPTTSNSYQPSIGNACCASFFTEFSADGSHLLYSSYFLGDLTSSSFTTTTGIALDGANNIWLSGSTTSSQFPLKYPLQSLPATQSGNPSTTAFLSRFDPTGASLTFSSYFGGVVQGGMIAGVAIDPNNHAHIAGTTGDGLFTTSHAYRSSVSPPPQFVQYTFGYAAVIDANTAAPSLCFNPQALFAGNVRVAASQTQTLTLTNCGNAPLTISSVQSSNPLFTIPAASNGCLQSVAANASCTVAVAFSPTAVGQVSGTLTITSNAPVSTASIAIQGAGAAPQISLQTNSVTFDPQFIGQTSPQQFVLISNTGGVPLTINLAQTTISAGFGYTQSGCDQPLGACALLLTFTPQAAGLSTGTLQIASDDPNNPVVSVNLSGTGYSSYPVPSLTFLSSPTMQMGSTQLSLQVYGSNFFPASVVKVGGVAQPTTYQSSTVLTATLDPVLVATIGELQVSVFTPNPGGGQTTPLILTVYQSIPIAARAMVYDPFGQLLYASIEAAATNNPNTIAVIDPVAGKVSRYIAVGNDPRRLAVSDDGAYLYVALDGDHAIQRINLSTYAIEKTFPLPVDSSFGLLTVADMKVVPGSPQSVVAALFRVASPAEDGIALYNAGGLVNWLGNNFADGYVTVDNFAFAANPPVIYSYPLTMGNAPGSFGTFGVFTIASAGIHVQTLGSLGGAEGVIASDGKLLYTNWGQVWNPPTTLVGTYSPALSFATVPSVLPDNSLGRTFFLNTFSQYNRYQATSVDAYDQNTLAFTGTVPFLSTSVYGPDAVALNRWGTDGFAFVVGDFVPVTGSGQVIMFRSSIAHARFATNPVPSISALSVSSVTAGGPAFVLGVQGSGFVPGSVLQWNGNPRATNFVSTTQLNANIPASDIAQSGTAQITVVNSAPGGGTSSSLTLTINPAPPVATFQPATLIFASQTVGTQSAAQTVTLQNTGGSALAISSIQSSGDFAETNNCPTSLAALASCTVSVTFTPSATGTRQATLNVADNSANSPQIVALSGIGTTPSFSFGTGGSNSSTATVTAGQTATYSLSIVSASGSSGVVTLTCTQVPVNATCTPNPASLSLSSGGTANFTVSVSTGGSQSASLFRSLSVSTAAFGLVWLLWGPLSPERNKGLFVRGRVRIGLFALVILSSTLAAIGCGGGGGSIAAPPSAPAVTLRGTYTIQIVATQGATTHSQPITLIVQ